MLTMNRTAWIMVCILTVVYAIAGCVTTPRIPKLPVPERAIDAATEEAENEYDRIARELKDAEKSLGRAAGRRLIARAAWGILSLSALIGVGSVAMLFVGGAIGIARGQAFTGFIVAGAGLIAGYFVTVYGVIFSEIVCWAVMIGLGAAGIVAGVLFVRAYLDTRTAKTLLIKRAANGESAKDAIQRLPVPLSIKKRLDNAWDKLRDFSSDSAADTIEAKGLLERFNLPLPKGTL
jgi:uncharacterized membrane protein